MAYDDDEWRQAKAAFAAENGAKVLRAPRLTSDPDLDPNPDPSPNPTPTR